MSSNTKHAPDIPVTAASVSEQDIEESFIYKLKALKYTHRPDIHNLDTLEANFREKFERLNAVNLSDSEFARLLEQITTPDVYKSAEILRRINSFERDDGTPLNFTLVNIKDWCKNDYDRVGMDEIIENDYNLNITRYVSTAEPEPIIDLGKTHESIVAADKDIREMTAKHNAFLKELGLPPLP